MFNPYTPGEQQYDAEPVGGATGSIGNDPSLPANQPSPFPDPESLQMVQDG